MISTELSIEEQLRELGFRRAVASESGWYVVVLDAAGEPTKIWATEDNYSDCRLPGHG